VPHRRRLPSPLARHRRRLPSPLRPTAAGTSACLGRAHHLLHGVSGDDHGEALSVRPPPPTRCHLLSPAHPIAKSSLTMARPGRVQSPPPPWRIQGGAWGGPFCLGFGRPPLRTSRCGRIRPTRVPGGRRVLVMDSFLSRRLWQPWWQWWLCGGGGGGSGGCVVVVALSMVATCVATAARPTPLVVRPPPPTMVLLATPTLASYLRRCDGGKDVEVSSVWLHHWRAVRGAQLPCRAGLWLFFSFLENDCPAF
jgi:hypothetical protein